jgi:WD repeat-containing protein 35
VFWDTKTDEKYMKYVKELIDIKGEGEYCAIFSKPEEEYTQV